MSKQNKMVTGSETSFRVVWLDGNGNVKAERVFNGPKNWMLRAAAEFSKYSAYGANWEYEDVTL